MKIRFKNKRTIRIILMALCIMLLSVSIYSFYSYRQTAEVFSQYGSRGDEVVNIQTRLKQWGYYQGSIDGIYGNKTVEAVKLFQKKNGLTADGVAGPLTLAKIGLPTGTASAGTSSSSAAQNQEGLNLLAHLITGEARGESYEGQVAVGAVVLNRVKHPEFPSSIAGVIYQPGAFSVVNDGQINLPIDASCYRAAQDALNGWDPVSGCIYYYNPNKTTNQWMLSRPIFKRIGLHVFTK